MCICRLKRKKTGRGRKSKKETLIFPRYHQWDVVNKLMNAARTEGPGHKYLIQHSAGEVSPVELRVAQPRFGQIGVT